MNADLIVEAFSQLYPDKRPNFTPVLKYSGKFKGFNANIKMRGSTVSVNLSKQWRGVSKDIQLGLIQDLLARLSKDKRSTGNIELYLAFMRNVHYAVPKTKRDDVLEASFNRVNERFFNGMTQITNFAWMDGTRTLGLYEYGTDTIKMTRLLAEHPDLMDYVMYHEMLHKKHKFYATEKGGHRHHSTAFREDEARFGDTAALDRQISRVISSGKRRSMWSWF
jgi:hypothetical protein